MITITAVIRAKPGCADALQAALLDVADHVRANEPETVDFFLSRSVEDDHVFTTYERFVDAAAKDRHNGSAAVARFFEVGGPLIEQPVILHTCAEYWTK
ncbi:MAG: antibiotic biosynthesis monooxygenase [Rhodobacteraceae bacterium]|nr:MAG: antibiotic biosynthesis monooxygenase [Paracoccaceae bacterium]